MSHEDSSAAYDILVVGAGAAGAMAAIRAGALGKRVLLVERNDALGKKILITGKGRCNLTNTAPLDVFIEKFGRQGQFLRSAFHAFCNEDLMEFFRSAGLETKIERQGRVFPVTDSARSVVETLKKVLAANSVKVLYGTRITLIKKIDGGFEIFCEGPSGSIKAKKVILATGGTSYKATGSTGDGHAVAQKLGHALVAQTPGLVPLTTKETWVKDLQGLGLENIRLTFVYGKKKIVSDIGELMFAHFGVSGPLVLDLSAKVLEALKTAEVKLFIDLKPGLTVEQLEKRLLNEFKKNGKVQFKNILKDFLPQRLIDQFLILSGIGASIQASQITQQERRALLSLFKSLPLTISGSLPIEEAMVTGGGVSAKEIDPRTMESRVMPGIYFAGEIIEGYASSGGYNLQQAFSTGYLAGEKSAESLA